MFSVKIVHDRKIKILEQRWVVLRAVLQDFLDQEKEMSARDLAHKVLMGQEAIDQSIPLGVAAREKWVELNGEPDTDEAQADLEVFIEALASSEAEKILATPTPELKETP